MSLPTEARIVIVGGGIAGCSTAYHLSLMGERDVLLLEQGKLTCGTTWHAAGLVGQMRPNRNMTQMSRYGIELYSKLEAETGLATGWKQCGSVNVAATPERMKVLRKQASLARSFGVEMEVIDAQRAGELYPLLRTDDLEGALWIPGDGKANPADLTMSLAKGARNRGVKVIEDIEVTGVLTEKGRVTGVRTAQCDVRCEILVSCAGQWARQFGRLAGVNVPLYSAEHFYIVTDRIDGVHPMLPVMRDPDGFIYYKEEVGGLVMGGFEPQAKPWKMDPIPSTFQFQLLGEDWDQFEVLMTNAIHRTPCLETAKVKMLLNGPESFTPDGNFILGEAPELRNYFVAAGFNSAGIANAGRAGRLIAEWIVGGEAPGDLWDVDIRRFGPFMANRKALSERTGETLGLHYAMRWPRHELETAPAAHLPAPRPAGRQGRGIRQQERLGARELLQAGRRTGSRARLGPAAVARLGDRRATRHARSGRALRPDLVLQAAAAGPRCACGSATPVRERDRHRCRPDGLYRVAERAWRLRERPDDHPAGAGALPDRHRLGADHSRHRLDRPPHRPGRAGLPHRRGCDVFRALGDGAEGARAARAREPRRPFAGVIEVLTHPRDRRRFCARARGTHELCRRAGLRALRYAWGGETLMIDGAVGATAWDAWPPTT